MISSVFGKESPVNFGLLTMKVWRRNHTHPKQHFWKTIFWPLRGVVLSNVYTCKKNDRVLLATPTENKGLLTIFTKKVKNWSPNACL